ncbi:hypothetical protein BH23PAT2_BH23PAT2_02630 [soil metagenome]
MEDKVDKNDYRSVTEKMATIAAVLYPMSAIPQAVKIYAQQQAAGLSLVSWIGFALLELVFLAYGIVHKLRPIIITGILWMLLYVLIVVGIVIYG